MAELRTCMLVVVALTLVQVLDCESSVLVWKQTKADAHEKEWSEYKQMYGKTYKDLREDRKRSEIFRHNVELINEHNALYHNNKSTFSLHINNLADLTDAEYSRLLGLKPHALGHGSLYHHVTHVLPDKVDWREKGLVTPVKDQGQCGSCWAFSTTGSLEGQLKRLTGTLTSLSEQNLVDCSLVWGNNGCEGGLMTNAYTYIKDNYGIDTEISYPYIAKDDICHYNASTSAGRDVGYVEVTKGDESELKQAVATVGPVSVGIDASLSSFRFYKNGIYNEPGCTTRIDHAVLVVGYDTQGFDDYWIVKNSWGVGWGEQGYIKMSRNKGNQCGIASLASYPLV